MAQDSMKGAVTEQTNKNPDIMEGGNPGDNKIYDQADTWDAPAWVDDTGTNVNIGVGNNDQVMDSIALGIGMSAQQYLDTSGWDNNQVKEEDNINVMQHMAENADEFSIDYGSLTNRKRGDTFSYDMNE